MEAGPAEELRQFVARAQVLDSFGWTRRDLLGHTASTQADAWQQVATAGPDYTGGLVVALRQSAGRGRLGRTWDSPAGNLCFSVVSRRTEPPHCSPGWAPLEGLAVAVVLQRYGVPTLVKWPNDVLIHGKKVCGILSEARGNWRVTGIGVNVNSTHHDLPEELQSTATRGYAQASQHKPTPPAFPQQLLCAILVQQITISNAFP